MALRLLPSKQSHLVTQRRCYRPNLALGTPHRKWCSLQRKSVLKAWTSLTPLQLVRQMFATVKSWMGRMHLWNDLGECSNSASCWHLVWRLRSIPCVEAVLSQICRCIPRCWECRLRSASHQEPLFWWSTKQELAQHRISIGKSRSYGRATDCLYRILVPLLWCNRDKPSHRSLQIGKSSFAHRCHLF